ncbi:MAG: hypothetical protein V4660_11505 [Pseudomonadota bacterium]
MFNPVRNDHRIQDFGKSRGLALLIMLAIILVAFTTVAISRLSVNSLSQKKNATTTQTLIQTREAILAFTLTQATRGLLPCPDGDGDGFSDPVIANICPNRRGLVPFASLNIPQPLDATGAPIWYVISTQYSGTPAGVFNSSIPISTLMLNQPMAFILLAPNVPFSNQARLTTLPLQAVAAQFLEGENADSSLDDVYTDVLDDTRNDQVLGVSVGLYWATIESHVLREVGLVINDYRTRCNVYPWPALYAPFDVNNSDNPPPPAPRVFEGRVPLNIAAPFTWGQACPPNIAPAAPPGWIFTHWGNMIYYAICRQPTLVNPPANRCLQLGGGIFAEAILIAPGAQLAAQDRAIGPVVTTDYFEAQNASTLDNTFIQTKLSSHTVNFNDLIYIIR